MKFIVLAFLMSACVTPHTPACNCDMKEAPQPEAVEEKKEPAKPQEPAKAAEVAKPQAEKKVEDAEGKKAKKDK